jgi:putative peptide zinc metalloprotease protein
MDVNFSLAKEGQVVTPVVTEPSDHLPHLNEKEMRLPIKLREGCKFYPYDGGQDKEEYIICTPDNRQFRISALAKDILERLNDMASLEEIALTLEGQLGAISGDELREFLESQYGKLGIFENSDSQANNSQAKSPRFSFLLHWDLIPEKYVSWGGARLRFLYNTAAVIPSITFIIVAHYFVYFHPAASNPLSNAGSLWGLLLCLLSILCHEFGHAAAVSKFGGSPGKIGFGLYLLLPSFYADVSEVWRFRRKQRMIVDLGGVYFQELAFGAFAVLGYFTSAPQYSLACHFIDLMVLLNLNPIFQFDGYWFLVDYLALPNLYRLALRYIKQSIKNVFVKSDDLPVLPPMRRHIYVLFVVYALLCNAFLLFAVWASYRYLNATFGRLPTLFPAIYHSIILAFETRDLALLLNRLVVLFFAIAFPGTALIGLYKYIVGLSRYCLRRIQAHRLP